MKGEVSPGEGPGRGVEKRGHAPREGSPHSPSDLTEFRAERGGRGGLLHGLRSVALLDSFLAINVSAIILYADPQNRPRNSVEQVSFLLCR